MIGPPFIKYGPPKPIDKPNKTKAIIKDEVFIHYIYKLYI